MAAVLAELPPVVESVGELVADRGDGPVGIVEILVAQVAAARQAVVQQRVLVGQARRREAVVVLDAGQDRQRRGVRRRPGEGRRQEATVVVDVVDLGAAVTDQAGEPVAELPALLERPAEIEAAGVAVEAAGLRVDLAELSKVGRLLTMLTRPPGLPWPYSTEAGPRST